jgi:hypothetical protein
MFICNGCLSKRFANQESIGKHVGPCEFCKEQKLCNEIQSGRLIKNKVS